MKELYLNFVDVESTKSDFFKSLINLNKNGLLLMRCDVQDNHLSEEAAFNWIDKCSIEAESDWKMMPNCELNPSQASYALLEEKGFGHP